MVHITLVTIVKTILSLLILGGQIGDRVVLDFLMKNMLQT